MKKNEQNLIIDKELFPDSDRLIIKGEDVYAVIVDEEIDPIKCDFGYDGCVTINTENYSYLVLSIENLKTLLKLTKQAEKHFRELYEKDES